MLLLVLWLWYVVCGGEHKYKVSCTCFDVTRERDADVLGRMEDLG
jgi:hypothetical protein